MNHETIYSLIQGGENSAVEFKSAKVRPDSLAREIVAFANSLGGIILLGIEDDGTITGLEPEVNSEEWVMNIARNNVIPPIGISFSAIEFTGFQIGVIQVPKGKDKPYQTSDFRFLVRVGSTNRQASIHELMRLFQQSGAYHFDVTELDGTSIKNLNLSQISSYFDSYKVSFEMLSEFEKIQLLSNTDILGEAGQVTVAGMLVFGTQPQKHIPMSGITFARFQGTEFGAELLDKQLIEGSLSFQIDSCTALIRNHVSRPSRIERNLRSDTHAQYSEKVFRELIVNACCHRNYSISGSRIRVFVFDDRLEVISPGRLPNSVSIAKLRAGVSYAVNPAIVKFMENLNYIDKLGRGLPMVCMEALSLRKEVLFEEIGEEFKVVLYL